MDDYIKRSEVISFIGREYRRSKTAKFGEARGNRLDVCKNILRDVNAIPASDVRENVHGDWVYQNLLFVDTIMCSVCGYNLPSDEFKTNFCPDCGSDMRCKKDERSDKK